MATGRARRSTLVGREHRRPLYPLAAGAVYARYRGARTWHGVPKARVIACRHMDFLLGEDGPHDVAAIARRYADERYRREEVERYGSVTRMPVDNAEEVQSLVGAGQPVLINFMHHGHYGGALGSLGRTGIEVCVGAATKFVGQRPEAFATPRTARHAHNISRNGAKPFVASFAAVEARLRGGEVVALASDMPGSTEVRFLGRRVGVSSGCARLAVLTGAAVVPLTAHRRGRARQRVRFEPALLPERFDSYRDLLAAIMRCHEPAVRAWPEAYDRPLAHLGRLGADVERFPYDPSAFEF